MKRKIGEQSSRFVRSETGMDTIPLNHPQFA
jgi:hypothetical protein